MSITTKWHVRVDYEVGRKTTFAQDEALAAALDEATQGLDDCEFFHGNAACGPYVSGTCDSLAAAQMIQDDIVAALKRNRVKTIEL